MMKSSVVGLELGDHSKLEKYSLIFLSGQGGIQTINAKNVVNSISVGYVPMMTLDGLKNALGKFDFTCLKISKRKRLTNIVFIIMRNIKIVWKELKMIISHSRTISK